MFERFTDRARTVVAGAHDQARALGGHEIGPEHLLLGLLAEGGGVGGRVLTELGITRSAVLAEIGGVGHRDAEALRAIGIDLDEVRRRAESIFGAGALDRPSNGRGSRRRRPWAVGGHLPLNAPAKQVLGGALRAAVRRNESYIGTEHLLLGLVAEPGEATGILGRLGMTLDVAVISRHIDDELGRAA